MRKIIIKDKIYGKFIISNPVILELLKSQPIKRLKKISQMGPPDKYYHLKNYSRFEHSIGVMLLLKHLGATKEEQIAGLLHDISHTAFSHVVDWVIGNNKKEEFQDSRHFDFIMKSEIKQILKKYAFEPLKIADYKKFKLLERDIPNLCADRIDYSLREFPLDIAKKCFSGLIVYRNKIIFNNKELSKLFALNFLKRQKEHWGGFEAVARYFLFAKVLRFALDRKVIEFSDFMKDEEFILKNIEKIADKKIIKILSLLQNKDLSFLPKSKIVSHKKFRYVDPEFISHNKLIRLSAADEEFRKMIEKAKEQNNKGIVLPLIS